jgi:hypothetical protein
MNRAIVVVVSIITLTCGGGAFGFDPFDPSAKKFMPKDQLEIFEKMEQFCKQESEDFFRIKDAKKRGEENERLGTEARKLHETIVNKLQTEGLKDWIVIAYFVIPDSVILCDGWQPIHLSLQLREKKVKGKIEDALNAIKTNDIVRFSTKADPKYVLPKQRGKTFGPFDQLIKIDSITSVEVVGTKPTPGKKTDEPKKK